MPAINIARAPAGQARWTEREFLFNIDPVTRWAARALLATGISLRPSQVIVGREGWLFLGDRYEATRRATRASPSDDDTRRGHRVGAALMAWDDYLAQRGVRLFRVVLLPNKDTVYPEYLPDWAAPPARTSTDAFVEGMPPSLVLDLRGTMSAAKRDGRRLYLRTDTHWNFEGAGLAFRALAERLGPPLPDLRWPDERLYDVESMRVRNAGDLASFLHLSETLQDIAPDIRALKVPIETEQFDYDSGARLRSGGNPQIPAPREPVRVRSKGALNPQRVLFLRDSFGNLLSPLMALTFSDTLHIHWSRALHQDGKLQELVESFKPDLVLIAVVERSIISPRFARFPMPPRAPGDEPAAGSVRPGQP